MKTSKTVPVLLATAFALAGCGGGSGGGGSQIAGSPPPPVTPPPETPPPAPPPPPVYTEVTIFPNVTTSTQFATLGYESAREPGNTTPLIGDGFSVGYDAAANNYVIDVPSSQPGVFEASDLGYRYLVGKLTDPSNPGQFQSISMGVVRPDRSDVALPSFQYTTWGDYLTDSSKGYFAFGSATPQSGVPVAGSAGYTAYAIGEDTLDHYVEGKATLKFDFAAGTLSGGFEPRDADWGGSLGSFAFVNTVFGSGQNGFSGELSGDPNSPHGSFDGMFTGPNAEELMARWSFPMHYSAGDTVFSGIWVGKKD